MSVVVSSVIGSFSKTVVHTKILPDKELDFPSYKKGTDQCTDPQKLDLKI